MSEITNSSGMVQVADPPLATALFGNVRWAWVWLIARLYIGYTWLNAGIGKIQNPAWTGGGVAIKGFWENAVRIPEPPSRPPIAVDWYRDFLQAMLDGGHYTWFSRLIISGEVLVGLAMILGTFVGVAAFFGAFMNWNFLMAGTVSTNPILLVISILLLLAWKTAGWWGLDRWLLPNLGTLWQPGKVFRKSRQ